MGTDQPDQRNGARPARPLHPLNLSLAGMPELELFESAEQRDRALREIAREFGSPRAGSWWLALAILLTAGVSTLALSRYALSFVRWPELLEESIRIGAVLLVAGITIRGLHRWGGAADLRRKLLELGVPVCRGCGYSLRGQPPDHPRCPECGRAIEARVREILRRAAAGDPPGPPA